MQLPERKSVGYIPTGSTNDLATTIGIPEDIRSAVQLIVTDQKNQYDIGLFNDRYFNYIATFGVGSEFSYMTPQKMKNVLGHSAYLIDSFILHLPRIFKSLKPVHMVVEYDGGVIEDDFIFGSVSNSTSVGGIFTFSRDDIRLNDGEFELLLARNVKSFAGAVELLMKVQKHNYDCNELIFTKTKKLKIHSSKPVAWSLDGEYGGEHSEAEISVLNNAIEIFSRKNDLFE